MTDVAVHYVATHTHTLIATQTYMCMRRLDSGTKIHIQPLKKKKEEKNPHF